LEGGFAQRAESFFAAFAHDADAGVGPVNGFAVELDEFFQSHAGAIEDFEDGGVAPHLPFVPGKAGLFFAFAACLGVFDEFFGPAAARGFEQGGDLFFGEEDGQSSGEFGQGYAFDGVDFHFAGFEGVLVEGAKGGEAEADGGGAEFLVPHEAVEVIAEVALLEFPPGATIDVGVEFDKGLLVIADGEGGLAAFFEAPFEEFGDGGVLCWGRVGHEPMVATVASRCTGNRLLCRGKCRGQG